MSKSVLISGIGIAGPTLAYWLSAWGTRLGLFFRNQVMKALQSPAFGPGLLDRIDLPDYSNGHDPE